MNIFKFKKYNFFNVLYILRNDFNYRINQLEQNLKITFLKLHYNQIIPAHYSAIEITKFNLNTKDFFLIQ